MRTLEVNSLLKSNMLELPDFLSGTAHSSPSVVQSLISSGLSGFRLGHFAARGLDARVLAQVDGAIRVGRRGAATTEKAT